MSKGCRSLRSVENGLRPNASETCLPAPANLPFGEDQISSSMLLVFTFSIVLVPVRRGVWGGPYFFFPTTTEKKEGGAPRTPVFFFRQKQKTAGRVVARVGGLFQKEINDR